MYADVKRRPRVRVYAPPEDRNRRRSPSSRQHIFVFAVVKMPMRAAQRVEAPLLALPHARRIISYRAALAIAECRYFTTDDSA